MKILFLVLLAVLSSGFTQASSALKVFAAASTREVVEYLQQGMTKENISLTINFDSSGRLARQICLGAEADIFISASERWKDYVIKKMALPPESSSVLMSNSLILTANKKLSKQNKLPPLEQTEDFLLFHKNNHFSIGNPDHVPAGSYAREALISYGLYKKLKARIIPAKTVRQALVNIEKGFCAMGIIYNSDAKASDKIEVIAKIPPHYHSPIYYYLVNISPNPLNKKLSQAAKEKKFIKFTRKRGFL